jgi:hypothetical protein
MSGHAAPTPIAPITPIVPVAGDGYVAGACNIGKTEIRRRRTAAVAGLVASVAVLVAMIALGLPAWVRLFLIVPFWGTAIAWLQARRRFCVAFAMAGVSNFGDDASSVRTVADPAQRDLDRRAIVRLVRDGFLIAVVPTILAVVAPV